jgi:ketosteroid isomerase-like protein
MSQPPLSILALGITPQLVYSVNNRLRAQGVDATSLVITNTFSSDAEIARVASSKNWSGLMVGYGVRNDRQWFKRVIQIIHDANPNIPLIDHHGPNDAENAIERHFNVRLPIKTT